jgi:type IV secretory pathway VirB2 component (pilin)
MKALIKKKKAGRLSACLMSVALLLFGGVPLFAAGNIVPQGLTSLAESLMEAFTGDVAQIIIGICFAGSCVAYAFNKDNEKMKGKIVAVVVATGLLALTQVVVDKVFQGAGG